MKQLLGLQILGSERKRLSRHRLPAIGLGLVLRFIAVKFENY